jgi:hypothetical protein
MGKLNEDRPLGEEETNDNQDCTNDEARGAGAEAIQAKPRVRARETARRMYGMSIRKNGRRKQGSKAIRSLYSFFAHFE